MLKTEMNMYEMTNFTKNEPCYTHNLLLHALYRYYSKVWNLTFKVTQRPALCHLMKH